MGEQGHDDDQGLCRGASSGEDGALGGAEGFVTLVADAPLVLTRVDADIAPAALASGRTGQIGAECGGGVHDCPPRLTLTDAKRSMAGPPFSLQVHRTTV
jgi:hypothetical protein